MTAWAVSARLAVVLALAIIPLSARTEIAVEDDTGSELHLEQPASRVISLAPNITEMLFFTGAGELLVGADEYSNYPEAARAITRVNNHAAANYELILALKPDVVFVWQSGNGDEIIDRLRQLRVPVFVIEPRRLEDIPDIFTRFGAITGNEARAAASARQFETRLAELRQNYSDRAPVSVFYQIWNEPLITLNGEHIVSDVIRLCGGRNVFADAGPLVPYVGIEAVIRANPGVIIASGSSGEAPRWLTMWDDWPQIDAVKHKRVHAIPPDLMQRHSMRILEGAARVCELLDEGRR